MLYSIFLQNISLKYYLSDSYETKKHFRRVSKNNTEIFYICMFRKYFVPLHSKLQKMP